MTGAALLTTLTYIAAGILVLILPGLVWLSWLSATPRDPLERLADMVAISLSFNALAALAAFYLGLAFFMDVFLVVYAILGVLGVITLALWLRHAFFGLRLWFRGLLKDPGGERATFKFNTQEVQRILGSGEGTPPVVVWTLFGLFAAILVWRFYQARDLVYPAWVDPLHHVLIVRRFLEAGGIPQSLEPYLPVPFYYHFGFHQAAALFTYLTGQPLAQAVLVLGQVLNAAVSLSVYRFAMAMWGDWRKAGIAAALTGFVTQMPAYYATWGRYTLLTGLVILLVAMAAVVEIARRGSLRERFLRLVVLTGGVILAHYFAAVLLAVFYVLVWFTLLLFEQFSEPQVRRMRSVMALLAAGVFAATITILWIERVWAFAWLTSGFDLVPLGASPDEVYFSDYVSYLRYLLGPKRNYFVLALGGLALLFSGWRLKTIPLTVWGAILALLAVPWGLRLAPFRPDHAVIVLFLPVSLLSADGLVTAGEQLHKVRLGWLGLVTVMGVFLGLLIWGVQDTATVINPVTIFAETADRDALDWIAEETPASARFFINVTPWQRGVYRGVDGGWWILPVTGRQTLVPPTMYVFGDRDYALQVNAWAAQAAGLETCGTELQDLVLRAQLQYLYLKQGTGPLQPAALDGCPGFDLVYESDGVSIFEVERAAE